MTVNRNDVAKLAGVSGATVSRYFNNPDLVSPDAGNRIASAAESLGYHTNAVASNFVRGKSGNIGVVIPYIPNIHIFSVYYFSELLSGISEALENKGYDLMLFFNRSSDSNDYSKYFKSRKVDGCILLGTKKDDTGLDMLKSSGYDFCLVNNYTSDRSINFIDVDNIEGAYQAVNHLLGLGHRRICFLNGPDEYRNSDDRLKGYKKALNMWEVNYDPRYVLKGNYGRKSGYGAVDDLLKLNPIPTAVFAANDRMAAGLIQGLKEKGMAVPDDISVTGYDDSDIATVIEPQLTTVHIPFFRTGKRCAEEFVATINGTGCSTMNIFIKPELIIRKSTAGLNK